MNEKFTSSKPDDVTTGVKPDDDTSNNNPNDDKTDTTKKKRDGRSTNVKSDNGSNDVKSNNGSTDVKSDNGSTDEKSNNGSTDVKSNNGSTDVKSDNGSTDVKSNNGSTDVKSNNGSTDVKSNNGSTDVKSDNGSTDVKSDDGSTDVKSDDGSTDVKSDNGSTDVKSDDSSTDVKSNNGSTDVKSDNGSTDVKSDNGSTDVKSDDSSTDVKSDNGSTDVKSDDGSTDVKSDDGSTDVKSDNGSTDVKSNNGSTDVKSNNGSTDVKSDNGSTDVKSDDGSTDVKSDDSSTNENDGNTENDDESKNANIISSNELTSSLHQVPRFAIPYIIIGIFVLITSVLFFYFLFTKPKDEPKYVGSEDSGAASDNFPFKTRVLLLLFCFYFLYVGGEVAYGSFVPMFASKSPHQFGQDRASHVAALFWGTFTLGRGLAICLASVVSPLKMVIADMVGCVTTSVILTLFADTNENVLWLGSALLGLSMASLFPTGIAWLETYTRVTGNTASFLVIGSALGEMCVPVVIGYLFEDIIGPMVLMYWMLATSALSALIFAYVMWLMMENGKEKESLPAEKSPALDLLHSVEEAFPGEEFFSNGTSSSKQMSKPLVPPILKKKDHRE
nr:dentin sialophosphoprotein-like [Lytechinus pictus]